jgi:hypothetical protein
VLRTDTGKHRIQVLNIFIFTLMSILRIKRKDSPLYDSVDLCFIAIKLRKEEINEMGNKGYMQSPSVD